MKFLLFFCKLFGNLKNTTLRERKLKIASGFFLSFSVNRIFSSHTPRKVLKDIFRPEILEFQKGLLELWNSIPAPKNTEIKYWDLAKKFKTQPRG